MGGLACDMDPIIAIARERRLKVIDDAAHALPCRYKGRMIGTIGDVTCFSFYSTKTITTGEGGMATTDDESLAERMRLMSLHGISKSAWTRYEAGGSWHYEILAPGFKYNMTDMAAALGLAQLARAEEFLTRRKQIAARYTAAFRALSDFVEPPPDAPPDGAHAWHLYVIRLKLERLRIDRDEFIARLQDAKIGVSVHFIPLHMHPYYRDTYGYGPEDFPCALGAYRRIISLPIYPGMTDGDVDSVTGAVGEICRRFAK
jgi:dTDP-4-amino-4,6-dideoxygalactose transaminase